VAAAVGDDDAPALHAADTLAVGGGLNDAGAVEVLVAEGSHLLDHDNDDGTDGDEHRLPFDAADLGLEAGHHRRRILHAGAGATGQVLTTWLLARAQAQPRISLHAHTRAERLIRVGERVVGTSASGQAFVGRSVVLASGGYAALWPRSTNAPETRGDGLRLAWLAGASLADLEFVQFHPTALDVPGRPALLLSEALRGEGARLLDASGQEVVDPLLPRDVLARALHRHRREHGPLYLSLQHVDPARVARRFGALAASLRACAGLDLAADLIPVAPAAHYCMGGIRTDAWGRTDVAGLYAAGEVACTGVQGANRLASNSLLECLVFGRRAAHAALADASDARARWSTRPLDASALALADAEAQPPTVAFDVARLDLELGVERDPAALARLVADLPLPGPDDGSDRLIPALVARAALLRAESRGAHFRTDAPAASPAWRGRIHWRRDHAPTFEEVLPREP
jgi:L-aspartate oxidase